MKKLLLLGGSRYLLPVIDAAHKLGHYVITCDYLPNNIAHKYSDEYHNVSIIEKEKVLELARKLKIDGIMSFACDPGVTTAAYVAEQMQLPNCGPYESVCVLQNKGKFRKFLSDNGFNVPVAKSYNNIDDAFKDVKLFNWPVIVKPTDSAGSKGVKKVETPKELKNAIEYALAYSLSNEYIIEDFLELKGEASASESFSVDGELKFVSFSAQYFDKKCGNPYIPSAHSWPTTISKENQQYLISEMQRLLKLLNMKNSIYNIEVRECTNGKAYIMECSPRGGGNRLAELIRYSTGIDLITNSVRAALGEPIIDIEQKDYNGHWTEIILHSNQNGIFKELWVSDKLSKNIIEIDLWAKENDKINSFTAANESIGILILKFSTAEELNEVLSNIEKYIKVLLK